MTTIIFGFKIVQCYLMEFQSLEYMFNKFFFFQKDLMGDKRASHNFKISLSNATDFHV